LNPSVDRPHAHADAIGKVLPADERADALGQAFASSVAAAGHADVLLIVS